jgi:2-methylcitrate dehydratase PrpD
MSLTRTLATFAAEAPHTTLINPSREVLKLSLLDWCAVGIAGITEPVSQTLTEMVLADGGMPDASIIGETRKVPSRAAALANGAISHALDYDDTHFDYIGHPSVVIFPAALAVAEKVDASGEAFLDAALIGMEVACRVGRWLGMGHYNHGFHQTATAGCFGAAAAAGRLLGLNAERMSHALGLAATRASGLKSQFGTMGKPYNAGIAASNGVEVALLAARGFVSRPDGIECLQGFGDTHAGEAANATTVLDGLGVAFRFADVQHKFHACCHGTHPTLEALKTAMGNGYVDPDDVRSVTLTVAPKWLRVCNLPAPTTGLEAKFSYKLTTAMAIAGRDTGALSTFSDAICAEPAMVVLRDKVEVETDDGLSDTAARVAIHLADGRNLAASHDLDQAIPIAHRTAKIKGKAEALLGVERARAFATAVDALENGGIEHLAGLLRG